MFKELVINELFPWLVEILVSLRATKYVLLNVRSLSYIHYLIRIILYFKNNCIRFVRAWQMEKPTGTNTINWHH